MCGLRNALTRESGFHAQLLAGMESTDFPSAHKQLSQCPQLSRGRGASKQQLVCVCV